MVQRLYYDVACNLHCRVKYQCLDTLYVRTLYLKVGSSDKGRSYASWYLGVTSLHISSESSTLHQNAKKTSFGNSHVQICVSSAYQRHHA